MHRSHASRSASSIAKRAWKPGNRDRSESRAVCVGAAEPGHEEDRELLADLRQIGGVHRAKRSRLGERLHVLVEPMDEPVDPIGTARRRGMKRRPFRSWARSSGAPREHENERTLGDGLDVVAESPESQVGAETRESGE